jgi:hypothetical protein
MADTNEDSRRGSEGAEPIRRRSPWRIIGIGIVVALAVVGLFTLAGIAFIVVSLNQWGSNK